jgi:cellulose synthase/poly-beta-1,6-N-acetylglucosamine synthase-like glycosyltransferase
MELIVRLHRCLRLQGKRYRITYVPDPICWTEAPEDLRTLKSQRIRWQRGLSESLSKNLELLFHRKGGTVGWLAFPFFVLFEWASPLIELAGYVFTIGFFLLGYIPTTVALAFFIAALGFGWLLSMCALLLEEISFHMYPKPHHIMVLFLVAVAESFGYRQLITFWRLIGLYRWAKGGPAHWGEMARKGSWQAR